MELQNNGRIRIEASAYDLKVIEKRRKTGRSPVFFCAHVGKNLRRFPHSILPYGRGADGLFKTLRQCGCRERLRLTHAARMDFGIAFWETKVGVSIVPAV